MCVEQGICECARLHAVEGRESAEARVGVLTVDEA